MVYPQIPHSKLMVFSNRDVARYFIHTICDPRLVIYQAEALNPAPLNKTIYNIYAMDGLGVSNFWSYVNKKVTIQRGHWDADGVPWISTIGCDGVKLIGEPL